MGNSSEESTKIDLKSQEADAAKLHLLPNQLNSIDWAEVDTVAAMQGLTPFTVNSVIGAWRHRHKAAFTTLGLGGITEELVSSIVDPYTGVLRQENFSNIFEHNLAVGFVSAILGDWLVTAGKIAPDERDAIVVHGLTHDATKSAEIFRARFFDKVNQAFIATEQQFASNQDGLVSFSYGLGLIYSLDPVPQAVIAYAKALAWLCIYKAILPPEGQVVIDAGTLPDLPRIELDLAELKADSFYQFMPHAPHYLAARESMPEAYKRAGYEEAVISQLMESHGYGGAVESMIGLLAFNERRQLHAKGSWIHKIVLLADNMTASPLPLDDQPSRTFFLTTRERQVVCDLARRYPSVYARGVGYNEELGFHDAEKVADSSNEIWIADYMRVQWYLSHCVAHELAAIHAGQPASDPDLYIKSAVNAALSFYK